MDKAGELKLNSSSVVFYFWFWAPLSYPPPHNFFRSWNCQYQEKWYLKNVLIIMKNDIDADKIIAYNFFKKFN